jgi:hypothetical protein
MADTKKGKPMPELVRFDDLAHYPHAHEFVGAEHNDVSFSVVIVHSQPGVGPNLHRHPKCGGVRRGDRPGHLPDRRRDRRRGRRSCRPGPIRQAWPGCYQPSRSAPMPRRHRMAGWSRSPGGAWAAGRSAHSAHRKRPPVLPKGPGVSFSGPSVDGREVVLVDPLRGLLPDPGALDIGGPEVEPGVDAAIDRVVDHAREPRVAPGGSLDRGR